MKNLSHATFITLSLSLLLGVGTFAYTRSLSQAQSPAKKETKMTMHATGTFEVKMTPQPQEEAASAIIGRMLLDKQFQGDLKGTSKGQMLAISNDTQGSAGYVAMEQVTGSLNGRSGSFALQHSGTMNRGTPQLTITVVPDSGTDQLKGIAGKMMIIIEPGKHSYTFDYTLPETP